MDIRHALPYTVASALCAYNHHFSLLFAALVGLSGLFLIPRKFLDDFTLEVRDGNPVVYGLYEKIP